MRKATPTHPEIRAPRAEWLEMLGTAARLAKQSKPIPILGCVRLEAAAAGEGAIPWAATDTEAWRMGELRGTATAPVVALVPVAQVAAILRMLPDGEVRLECGPDAVIVRSGQYQARVPSYPVDDFPAVPALPQLPVLLPAKALLRLAQHAAVAVDPIHGSYYCRGIRLQVTADRLVCSSTDQHRLTVGSIALETANEVLVDALLAGKALQELKTLGAGDVIAYGVDAAGGHTFVRGADRLVVREIADKQPNLTRVIPSAPTTTVEVDRGQLAGLLQRVGLAADVGDRIDIEIGDASVRAGARSPERGDADDEVEADVRGALVKFAVSYRYLLDGVEAATDAERVRLEIASPELPIAVRPVLEAADLVYAVALMR